MSTFFSDTAWICLAVPTVLCGTVFCKYKKSSGQLWSWMVCLAGLCAVCLLILSPFWGLVLFSVSCFLMYTYLSGQELLPVDQKAVLVTGLWAVINNAGVLGFPTDGELLLMTDYKQCMAVNFFGTVEVTKTFL
ncbi:HSD17B2 isoform 3, partial [Pan troglodytes]